MKKILAGILFLALAASMSIPAFAENTETNDGTKGTDITVNGTYQAGAASAEVISVDIAWEAMDFTYTAPSKGTWNPGTHEYENAAAGGWAATSGTDPKITFTNHSNVDVKANFSFSGSVDGLNGSFTKDTLALDTAVGTEAADAPTDETAFSVSGSGIDADREIGTITVTVIKGDRQYVSTAGELAAALKKSGSVRLTDDITTDQELIIPEYKEVTIDLNGHTLTGSGATVFEIKGTATIKNGTIAGTGADSDVYATIYNNIRGIFVGKNLTVSAGAGMAVVAQDATKTELIGCTLQSDSNHALELLWSGARIVDCKITAVSSAKYAIAICSESSNPAALYIGGNTEVNTNMGLENAGFCTIIVEDDCSFDPEEHIISELYQLIPIGTKRWTFKFIS